MKQQVSKQYIQQYLDDCVLRKRLSQKTIKAYRIDLNQFYEFLGLSNDDSKKIVEYIHFLNQKYVKYKIIKRKLASSKAYYAYLEYEEIIDVSPFRKIRTNIKEPKILPRIIPKDNLKEIFDSLSIELLEATTPYKKH